MELSKYTPPSQKSDTDFLRHQGKIKFILRNTLEISGFAMIVLMALTFIEFIESNIIVTFIIHLSLGVFSAMIILVLILYFSIVLNEGMEKPLDDTENNS